MADAREVTVWIDHAAQQMQIQAYALEGFPGRLRPILEAEPWASVLDFGCGTGLWRNLFRPHHYVGLDQSTAMIAGAQRRWAEDDAEFVLCPDIIFGAKIPFEDSTFDIVFTSAVLQHNRLEDKNKLLSELRRVLRTNGRYVGFENTYGDFNPGSDDGYSYTQEGWRRVIEPHRFAVISQDKDLHVFRAI